MLDTGSINRFVCLAACVLLLAACAPKGVYHTVRPGQTLYSISRVYNIEEGRLARINRISDPKKLKVNQKLYVPGVSRPRKVPVTTSKAKQYRVKPTPAAKTATVTAQKDPVKKTTSRQVKSPPPVTSKPVKGLFVWPVKGKVLNKFGSQGQKVSKGIEISAPQGTTVVAAASGKVIYSGNAIAGYGNLVILEHSDSFFSVYGFNQKCLVKMDDHVGQGEKIALSGAPQNGGSARLHFEIRKGKSAVDPILYLP